jgi:hypothetical protein
MVEFPWHKSLLVNDIKFRKVWLFWPTPDTPKLSAASVKLGLAFRVAALPAPTRPATAAENAPDWVNTHTSSKAPERD